MLPKLHCHYCYEAQVGEKGFATDFCFGFGLGLVLAVSSSGIGAGGLMVIRAFNKMSR